MEKKLNYKNLVIISVVCLSLLLLIILGIIPIVFLGFLTIGLFILLVRITMYSINVKNTKLVFYNMFFYETFDITEILINDVHSFNQGTFCLVMNDKRYRIKATKKNYEIVYNLLKQNHDLQIKMDTLKRNSFLWIS